MRDAFWVALRESWPASASPDELRAFWVTVSTQDARLFVSELNSLHDRVAWTQPAGDECQSLLDGVDAVRERPKVLLTATTPDVDEELAKLEQELPAVARITLDSLRAYNHQPSSWGRLP